MNVAGQTNVGCRLHDAAYYCRLLRSIATSHLIFRSLRILPLSQEGKNQLIRSGFAIKSRKLMDWRPVYAAASSNNADLLAALENDGQSFSLADPVDGCTPLYAACWSGCLEAVSFLLGEPLFS
jgi:hypothetical protein